VAEERITLLTAREAAKYLRVSLYTLNKIEKKGQLVPFRTPGGHRRYSLEMLNEYLESSRFLYGPPGHEGALSAASQAASQAASKAAESVARSGLGSEARGSGQAQAKELEQAQVEAPSDGELEQEPELARAAAS